MTQKISVRAADMGPLGVLTAAHLLLATLMPLAGAQRAAVATDPAAAAAGAPAADGPAGDGDASALSAAVPGDL